MTSLLDIAITAHGGWDRWETVNRLTVNARIGGGVWAAKGQGGHLDDVEITLDTHSQHVEYAPFGGPGQRGVYRPTRTAIETDDGSILDSRQNPRNAFAGHTLQSPWDSHHLIYFSGYAIWTYLTTPFLFRLPGFETTEIEPWKENGEEWRRLKVTFPVAIHSHSAEQVFYFDAQGLLRRHDYSADVIGGAQSANYATDPKDFGGLIIPTKRRVYARDPDNHPLLDRLAVSIDIDGVVLS